MNSLSLLGESKSQEVRLLSDIAHLLPRCPRCGYGLRMVRGYWWCDVCRAPLAPQRGPSLRETFRRASETLRRFFAPPPRRRRILVYPASVSTTTERGPTLARCPTCGALTPRDAVSCVHCGAAFGRPAEVLPPGPSPTPRVSQHDEVVYRYIVENTGEISLSKASADLHMTIPELQASVRRLEDSGRLSRDSSQGG